MMRTTTKRPSAELARKRPRRELTLGYLMIFPSLGLIAALFLLPIVIAVRDSMYHVNTISGARTWQGIGNFVWLLTDPTIRAAFERSLMYAVCCISGEVVLGVLVANLLRVHFRGRAILRSLVIAPYVVPTVVVVLVWRYLLDPSLGVLNLSLNNFRVTSASPAWLADPHLAFPSAIVVTIWKYTPFMEILFAARLQTAPEELYEAASLDGANAWGRMRYVTLPWLAPVIGAAIAIRGILAINEFDILYLLTSGGPLGSTTTVPLLIRAEAFEQLDSGRASAIAVSMAIFLLLVIGAIFLGVRRRRASGGRQSGKYLSAEGVQV